jgi:hypothetical protein
VLHRKLDHCLHLRFDGNVGADEDGRLAQSFGQPLSSLLPATRNDDLRAMRHEELGGLRADAAGPTANDGHLALENAHCRSLPSVAPLQTASRNW